MTLEAARAALRQHFGYSDFRPAQIPVVESLLSGRNALAVMPTGAGKSLCFQIPALVFGGLTVVVSPLVALMEDQVAALKLAGVAAETINSARDREVNVDAWHRVAAGEVRFLYLSPERLMTPRMIGALQRLSPVMFAIDEAHCISRWGAAFRPEYEQLSDLKREFPEARLAAFTATADAATREDIAAKLFGDAADVHVAGFDRPNITLGVTQRIRWQDQLAAFLKTRAGESGIVYCLSRKNVEQVAAHLAAEGVTALPYHAGLSAEVRTANQDRFMTENQVVMVATIAFGMGIDKPDIRFVFHTHLPANVEAYYQEIGRAGRDGTPAEALMLYGFDDIRLRRQFIEEDGGDPDHKRREHKRLDALLAYAEAPSCRRVALLQYFGEESKACGNCDVCLDPPKMIEATRPAQMALSAVARTGERFGASHIIDILRGAETEKLRQLGHDRLPTHGVGKDWPKARWQGFLRQMVAAGHLSIDIKGFGGLTISESGHAILRGDLAFDCREEVQRVTERAPRKRAEAAAAPELTPEEQKVFARLKTHRLELARARSVPPYVIFHDRTLAEMARRRPRDREAFADLPGVGARKCEDFAEAFLAVLWQNA